MLTFIILYALGGIGVGILAGFLGLGGGAVVIPILHFTFGLQQFDPLILHKLALGTCMASIMFTAISSSLAHSKRGGVLWDVVKRVTPSILFGTFLGSFLASKLPTQYLQIVFIFFLCYVIYTMLFGKKTEASHPMPTFFGLSCVSTAIGLFSSLVGIGGGMLWTPYLMWHNIDMRKAIGTSAAIGFPIAVGGCIGYIINGIGVEGLPEYSLGYVYLPALLPLVAMSMTIAPIGAKLTHKVPIPVLKKCFAFFLMFVVYKMIMSTMALF